MDENVERECAMQPEDLSSLIFERLNAADVDGLVALYEPNAVLALPGGQVATGADEIRKVYEQLVADRPTFTPGVQRPTLDAWPAQVATRPVRHGHASRAPCGCSAARIAAGHAFVQNLRRGHYELATDAPPKLRLATAFTELAQAM